jgi:hypothetical protein
MLGTMVILIAKKIGSILLSDLFLFYGNSQLALPINIQTFLANIIDILNVSSTFMFINLAIFMKIFKFLYTHRSISGLCDISFSLVVLALDNRLICRLTLTPQILLAILVWVLEVTALVLYLQLRAGARD